MQTRTLSTLVAVFRSDADARAAADDLRANGFDSGDIFITAENTTSTNESVAHEYRRHEGGIKGWFHSLFGENQEETDQAASEYENAINTGNVLLSVEATDQNLDRAADILNGHSPINMHRDKNADEVTTTRAAAAATPTTQAPGRSTNQQAIPVVHEELKVGKRAILRGGVRVYSRVVEQPVEETIGLREEHVRVDRTPVNREVTDADLRSRGEQVIEVKEFAEEPVISKTARVVEEVQVHKDATERQQTVRDTVRQTEVRVEDLGREATDRPAGAVSDRAAGAASDDYRADFRRNFDQRYASSGESFDTYAPAYEYGYTVANDPRYRGRNFEDVEQDLRTDYGRHYPNSTWERMKDSIRYGWDRLRGRA